MATARYARLDSDEERLPEGMERIGYDADEQRYTYRDHTDGSLWEGEEGQRYGLLHPVGQRPRTTPAEAARYSAWLRAHEREAWGYLLPFLLLVAVFLLLVFRITHPPGGAAAGPEPRCAEGQGTHTIVRGDTCWDLATRWGVAVEDLVRANDHLDCAALPIGRAICVPAAEKQGVGAA